MKKILFILLILSESIAVNAGMHTYASHSKLQTGRVMKVRIQTSGVHMIPYDTLTAWGLNPDSVRVLGYGGAMLNEKFNTPKWDDLPCQSIYLYKGADGVFNHGDYLLFYAQGTDSWKYGAKRWRHTRNPYSWYGYYFVTDQGGTPEYITPDTTSYSHIEDDIDWYSRILLHEVDSINLIDISGVAGGGREFYGETFSKVQDSLVLRFDASDVLTTQPMQCYINLAAYSSVPSTFTATMGSASSSKQITAIKATDFYTMAECDSIIFSPYATTTGTQTLTLRYSTSAAGAYGFLNFVELAIPCRLAMRGDQMLISNAAYAGTSTALRYHMANASPSTMIWRLSDGVHIQSMSTRMRQDTLLWDDMQSSATQYVAINPAAGSFPMPQRMGLVPNQDLHALNDIDYVIITIPEFVEQATRLAQKHQQVDALTWAVVTDQQVYNEFSSGTPDVTAYRWLMKMLWDRANGNEQKQPKNLLLMGSGSYDNRRIQPYKSGTSLLLQYEAVNSTNEVSAYACDDYCTFMDDNDGIDSYNTFNDVRATMDLGVGRLPVTTLTQATQVVDKITTYMDNLSLGKWKTQLCFLADDGDRGLHVQTADAGAERIRRKNPYFQFNKIYLDAYTQEVSAAGESYPLAKNQFDNLLSQGILYMNYSGHGGYNNICSEQFLTSKDARDMVNTNQGLWMLATCSFAHYDGGHICAAEEAVLNPYGGAIGVISACRTVYASQNTVINRNICDTLFGHSDVYHYNMTFGQTLRYGKNITGRDANKMAYVLLGDPALKLNYPTQYHVRTITRPDTLHALTVQTIKGFIENSDRDTATWFNGKLSITIMDKMQQITTRDNDQPTESEKVKVTYLDYPNTLFAGETTVQDGKFEFTFMVPKDIRYNYGAGRIAYYAMDSTTNEEGIGHFTDFIIGGSSSIEIPDTTGPEIALYLNNPLFVDGGTTYEYPHFYADLYDDHGINTVGTGIGHDLLMVIDGDSKMTYTLNDYYQSSNNNYKSGHVSFQLPEMEEGPHYLSFRAWDLLNNSTTKGLTFQVVRGQDPQIYSVTTYPNPVQTNQVVHIQVEYDQPDEIVETTVYVYDMSGRLVLNKQQLGTDNLQWKLSQYNFVPGVYFYNVQLKTARSSYVSKTGKLIVNK